MGRGSGRFERASVVTSWMQDQISARLWFVMCFVGLELILACVAVGTPAGGEDVRVQCD